MFRMATFWGGGGVVITKYNTCSLIFYKKMAKNYKLIANNHCDHIVVSVKCMLELASVLAAACREHVTAKRSY